MSHSAPRIKQLNTASDTAGKTVIYLMSRDQRVDNNFALLAAQKQAIEKKLPLIVIFNLYPNFHNRIKNQFLWMIEGLKEVEAKLKRLNIIFQVLPGKLEKNWTDLEKMKPAAVYFDFSPLKNSKKNRNKLSKKADFPCFVVDTHNIVPVWEASNKQEWAAWTFRKKITPKLNTYLKKPEEIKKHPVSNRQAEQNNWQQLTASIKAPEIKNYHPPFKPGREAALNQLKWFLENALENYIENKNDPNLDSTSQLSPYLHFGQISSLEAALQVKSYKQNNKNKKLQQSKEDFLEELIVRKELSDNFCFYNPNYDSLKGAPDWAKKTLKEHENDKRQYLYSETDLESAQTHSKLWNASQAELKKRGKMSGYLRMFWAKKILEWSKNAEEAIDKAIYLNDKYELDGGDPNGYTGIMWSIAGVHDRAWAERRILGKIRYMNANGAKKKFDTKKYIKTWLG